MAEDILRTAFALRDLMQVLVVLKPRSGPKSTTSVLMAQQENLGAVELAIIRDLEKFVSPSALGLNHMSTSWWVDSHGRWCPQHVEREISV